MNLFTQKKWQEINFQITDIIEMFFYFKTYERLKFGTK